MQNCGRQEGKIMYVTSSCQGPGLERPDISVSHWVPAVSRSLQPMYALPAAAQLQPGAHTVLQAINVPLAPQALRFRSVLPLTWQQPGSQHLWNEGQDRWDLAWVWDQRPRKSSTGLYRVDYEQEDRQLWTDHLPEKALQLRLLRLIIHTLFPFYVGFTHGFRIRICW